MNWLPLTEISQLEQIREVSKLNAVIIFKHSTRCSISHMAKSRLERETAPKSIDFYYLDLLKHRDISNTLAEQFHVFHESPQILLIKNAECIYDQSHNGITMDDIKEQIELHTN